MMGAAANFSTKYRTAPAANRRPYLLKQHPQKITTDTLQSSHFKQLLTKETSYFSPQLPEWFVDTEFEGVCSVLLYGSFQPKNVAKRCRKEQVLSSSKEFVFSGTKEVVLSFYKPRRSKKSCELVAVGLEAEVEEVDAGWRRRKGARRARR